MKALEQQAIEIINVAVLGGVDISNAEIIVDTAPCEMNPDDAAYLVGPPDKQPA